MRILCVVAVAFGAGIMLYSIMRFYKFLAKLKAQVKTESLFSNWIYAACFIMMLFFLIGYVICMIDYLIKKDILMPDLLIASIFFFGAIFVFSVITMIQRMFYAISEKSDQLGLAREIAEHSSRAKSIFLTNISHEIRTPLNAIIGMNELLIQEDIPHKAVEYALHAKQAGTNMLALVDELLDFSKIEAGKLTIEQTEYSFASLINDTINLMHMRVKEKGILFTANVDSNIPGILVGDPQRIREIFINLLSNAVKYTNEGFVSFNIRCNETETGIDLIAEVSDSGIGIKPESMDLLFDLFFREDTPGTKGIEGTGLGLAITKKLCVNMGGDVTVESEFGVGSTFTVTLPQQVNRYVELAKVENPAQKTVLLYEPRAIYAKSLADSIDNLGVRCVLASSSAKFYEEVEKEIFQFIFVPSFLYRTESRLGELTQNSKLVLITEFEESIFIENTPTFSMPVYSTTIANILNEAADNMVSFYSPNTINKIAFVAPLAKILIVDDLSTNLTVAEGLISKYKMQIKTCKSGMEAIAEVSKTRYDIIFMDHAMPEMDGIEATIAIRALEEERGNNERVPIIALTANAVSGMKEIFLQNQMSDFLAKPIEALKLDNILKKWIPKDKQEQPETIVTEKTEKNEVSKMHIDIDGIDVKMGLLFSGGELEIYLKALAVFYKDGKDKLREIRNCLENNDIKLYTTIVHGIKSSALNIGAREISDYAKDLEKSGRNGTTIYITENNDAFLEQLNILLENINAFISTLGGEKDELEANDLVFLKASLTELKTALVNMNAGAICSIIENLENGAWDKKYNESIQKLAEYILLCEYEEAIALIDSLC